MSQLNVDQKPSYLGKFSLFLLKIVKSKVNGL